VTVIYPQGEENWLKVSIAAITTLARGTFVVWDCGAFGTCQGATPLKMALVSNKVPLQKGSKSSRKLSWQKMRVR